VTHLNKSAGGPAIYRTIGSIAFAGAARAVWSVSRDKDEPRRRLFLPVKNNLAEDTGGLAYEIVDGHDGHAVLAWEPGPVDTTADEALGNGDGPKPGTKEAEAVAWLQWRLGSAGPVPATTIIEEGGMAGHREKTLRRAKEALGVVSRPTAFGGPHVWEIPQVAKASPLAPSGHV
jgi:putative DNA primase/helicase